MDGLTQYINYITAGNTPNSIHPLFPHAFYFAPAEATVIYASPSSFPSVWMNKSDTTHFADNRQRKNTCTNNSGCFLSLHACFILGARKIRIELKVQVFI